MISGHSISTGFRRLTCCQWDPWDRGVTFCMTELIDPSQNLGILVKDNDKKIE